MQNKQSGLRIENRQRTRVESSQMQQPLQQQLRQQPSRQQQPPRQQSQNNPYAKPILNKCLKWREPNHQLNDCRSKNLNLVEAKVDEIEINIIENGNDEEALELKANEGEMLSCIVQKILLALKFEEDNQGNKIFRTCETINDKVCNAIIDSGSVKGASRRDRAFYRKISSILED